MLCMGIWAPKPLSLFNCVASFVISIISCTGNGLIIAVVYKDPLKKLRTPFNFFLVNLSVSDLIVGCVTMPISVYGHYREYTGYMDKTISDSIHLSSLMSESASLLSIIVLSVDRYFAVAKPIEYREKMGWRRCALAASLIWVVSLSAPFTIFVFGYMQYLMYFMSTAILTGVVVMVIISTMIRKTLRKQNRKMTKHDSSDKNTNNTFHRQRMATERKVTRLFFLVTAVFTIIYLPAAVIIFVLQFCQSCNCTSRHVMRDVQFLLTAANSLANPFVCTLRSKMYKNSVKKMFGCREIVKAKKSRETVKATKSVDQNSDSVDSNTSVEKVNP